jgi:SAM-dependent methyltransferase
VTKAGAGVTLVEGSATAPPFESGSFDRVLSTLMLHHLDTAQKHQALAACRRLLRPGGEIHIVDFGKPHNALMRIVSLPLKLGHGGEAVDLNHRGGLPEVVAKEGFADVAESERWMTPFGTIAFVRGVKTDR